MRRLLGLLLVPVLVGAAGVPQRSEIKCGYVLAARAEKAHRLALRVARVPRPCGAIHLPTIYQSRVGPYGAEIWKGSERLVFAVDTAEHPIYDLPPSLKPVHLNDDGSITLITLPSPTTTTLTDLERSGLPTVLPVATGGGLLLTRLGGLP